MRFSKNLLFFTLCGLCMVRNAPPELESHLFAPDAPENHTSLPITLDGILAHPGHGYELSGISTASVEDDPTFYVLRYHKPSAEPGTLPDNVALFALHNACNTELNTQQITYMGLVESRINHTDQPRAERTETFFSQFDGSRQTITYYPLPNGQISDGPSRKITIPVSIMENCDMTKDYMLGQVLALKR